MKGIKRKITLLAVCCTAISSLSAQTISVREKNGTLTQYTIAEINKITFAEEVMTVRKKDGAIPAYNLQSVQFVDFSKLYSAIHSVVTVSEPFTYPNPVSDNLTVVVPNNTNSEISLSTLDGKLVYYRQILSSMNLSSVNIQLSGFERGVYMCTLKTSNTRTTAKVIKQ